MKPETPINLNQWVWGERAKLQLVQLLANRQLLIVERSRDFYGRSLCDWYLDDLNLRNNLQIQLARLGMAAHFLPINLYDFPGNDLDLYCEILRATAEAKQNKIGFWSDPKFVLPYQYRKSGKL
ncbi:MAG TPA: thermonuclease family protein [Oscillatoriales cyanobacterium M59_W2019_021]|nr:thermonuclease family protein [Oscillatoriales cyanobacterium M4454_W2019_049]HIK49399.1 thermonuclease family protein [Oscillatoriales cyanobacterium M59_W2019_021]